MSRALVAAVAISAAVAPCGPSASAAKPPPLGADEAAALPALRPPPLGAPAPGAPPSGAPPFGAPPFGGGPREAEGGRATLSGSGFLVADGRVLTNAHVVESCTRVVARNAQMRRTGARVEAIDPRRDLALLSVPPGFGPPLVFRSGPAVVRGETVVTYGFPLSGLLSSGPTLTTGDVSALSGLRDTPLHFQISAPVQPGNSGGPLLDAQAHVIGVVVSKLNAARVARLTGGDIPQNVNFAIKGSEALAFLAEHSVKVATAASTGADRRASEVGAVADPSTVFLQCLR